MKSEWFHLDCLSYSTWSRTCSSHLHATLLSFVNFSRTWAKRTETSQSWTRLFRGWGGGRGVRASRRHLRSHARRYSPCGKSDSPGSTVARDFAVAHLSPVTTPRLCENVDRAEVRFNPPRAVLRAAVLWSRLNALVEYHSTPRGRYTRIHVSCVTPWDTPHTKRACACVCMCAQNRARRGDQAIRKENGRSRFDIYRDSEKKQLALRSDLFIEPGIDPLTFLTKLYIRNVEYI